jgi:excisionase family DNA binding protein
MKLLSLEAVAETLAVSRQTIQRMIDTGAFPAICVRSGRRKKLWRVRPEQLQQWLLQKERETSKRAKSQAAT